MAIDSFIAYVGVYPGGQAGLVVVAVSDMGALKADTEDIERDAYAAATEGGAPAG